jgi:hypothetical protein
MRTTPFAEIVVRRRLNPEQQAELETMRRASRKAVQITQSLRDEGVTEQHIIDKLQAVVAGLSGETELYRTTFRDYIDAMRRDQAEAAVREEPAIYLDSSTKP